MSDLLEEKETVEDPQTLEIVKQFMGCCMVGTVAMVAALALVCVTAYFIYK